MEHLQILNASPDLAFPWRLYLMLRDAETDFPDVVGWTQHGQAFQVYHVQLLERSVLSKYFSTTKYASFRRQLHSYGFQPLGKRGKYMHQDFRRHDPAGCERVVRTVRAGKKMSSKAHQKLHGHATANPPSGASSILSPQNEKYHNAISPDLQPARYLAYDAFASLRNVVGGLPWMMSSSSSSSSAAPSMSDTSAATTDETNYPLDHSICSDARTNNSHGVHTEEDDGISDYDDDLEPLLFDPDGDEGSSSIASGGSSLTGDDREALMADFLRHYPPDRLDETWKIDGLHGLEPRAIQSMVAAPNPWYEYSPSMVPEVQAIIEQLLAVTLPIGFYAMDMSWWGHFMAWVLVLGHSLESVCTNFGGQAWYFVDIIGPIQHVSMDLLWNHIMISMLMLLGIPVFGPHCKVVAVALVPTLPIMICADFKTHFLTHILEQPLPSSSSSKINSSSSSSSTTTTATRRRRRSSSDPKVPQEDETTRAGGEGASASASASAAEILKHQLGAFLSASFLWYLVAAILLAAAAAQDGGSAFASSAQVAAVFFFNLAPLFVDLSYAATFPSRLYQLPPIRRTVLGEGFRRGGGGGPFQLRPSPSAGGGRRHAKCH